MKAYTDLKQSRKLAKILPLESADMCYLPTHIGDEHHFIASLSPYSVCTKMTDVSIKYCTPCWSLAALFGVLPEGIIDNCYVPNLQKENGKHSIAYGDDELLCIADNPVDACVAMIEHLHELNLL